MHFKKSILYSVICLLALSGCKNSFDESAISAGNADFTHFVALGGNYTAGFGDGALAYDIQLNSYPAILATRFALVGGGSFKQPMVNPGIGLAYDANYNLISKLILTIANDCNGEQSLIATRTAGDASNEIYIGCETCPFNNLGVPGAKSFNLSKNTFGRPLPLGNPFYHRFATNPVESSTILGDASKINPTFFVLWVGNEDVWQYAKSGGIGDLDSIGLNDITPVSTFQSEFNGILSSLLAGNLSKGAIANIPDIDCFPFFAAIPYNGLQLTKAEADALNAISDTIFQEGANAYVVYPPNSGNYRQLKEGEYVLMSVPMDSIKCAGWGTPQHPIPDYYILDSTEVRNIRKYTEAYNAIIAAAASNNDLAFVDMQYFFRKFKSAQLFNGVKYTNQYLKSSIFSLDGLYPNARGHAHIANAFIRSINGKYMSTLPQVDVNSYRGNTLP